ncbi:MAG: tRNA (adenosine(37)-N6)-threonylcarbamoyltransferase complex ATPase subunit type 1 TsaE, partial [Phycisphaerales bacterium]|nr:tRNA (adenosine(37)-N6)-threonylcarbamoyltransferase complex ATPase subunit type 1 TsaE [Phycisphaerales bacterium]
LAHEYPVHERLKVVHVDCYRINGPSDLDSIGWESFAGHEDAITIVEWGSRISDVLGGDTLVIDAGHTGDTSRIFEIGAQMAK